MPGMCAIGSRQDLTVAGSSPTSVLLGGGASGSGSAVPSTRRVAAGTLLTGNSTATPSPAPGATKPGPNTSGPGGAKLYLLR